MLYLFISCCCIYFLTIRGNKLFDSSKIFIYEAYLLILFQGGLKSAIHVDMIQGLVMIACSFVIIVKGSIDVPGGIKDVFEIPNERDRLHFFE